MSLIIHTWWKGSLLTFVLFVCLFVLPTCHETVIPKRNSVFEVEINGFVSHIYGSKFEQRASERSAKKFKVRGTIDLWRHRVSLQEAPWPNERSITHSHLCLLLSFSMWTTFTRTVGTIVEIAPEKTAASCLWSFAKSEAVPLMMVSACLSLGLETFLSETAGVELEILVFLLRR